MHSNKCTQIQLQKHQIQCTKTKINGTYIERTGIAVHAQQCTREENNRRQQQYVRC